MKKLFSSTGLIFFLLAISLVSCKKEKTDDSLLIGKWNTVSQKLTEYANNVKTDEETNTYEPGDLVVEIFENGTGKVYEDGETIDTFNWKVDGDLLKITSSTEGYAEAEFTVNEDTLTLKVTIEETYNGTVYKSVSEIVYSRA
jgi:hypothetical protein